MKHNKIIASVILVLTVAIAAGAVILAVRLFSDKGFVKLFETDGIYHSNGFLFLPEKEGENALYYLLKAPEGSNEAARRFIEVEEKKIDLSRYGFEGDFSYYVQNGFAVPRDPAYEGFWPVSSEEKLIYLNGDEKWRIDTVQGKAYPMFSDSVEGVDPYGKDVLAFSAGGVYAIAFDGKTATVYESDSDAGSMKIEKVRKIDLSSYGSSLSFHAFVNGRDAFFSGVKDGSLSFFALNCQEMTVAQADLPEGEYGELLSRVYLVKKEAETEKKIPLSWVNCLLGTEYSASLPKEAYRSAKLRSVSPLGNFAVAETVKQDGSRALTVLSRKNAVDLLPGEGEELLEIAFAYDNVILASFQKADGTFCSRGYKISF